MVGLPRRPKLSQLKSIRIRQTPFFVLNLLKEIHNRWTGRCDPKQKKKGWGASARERRDEKSRTRLCFSLSFFLTCQTHKAGEGDQGRHDLEECQHVGDGERQRDGGGARVRRKENKDRTQSNQQQLNA